MEREGRKDKGYPRPLTHAHDKSDTRRKSRGKEARIEQRRPIYRDHARRIRNASIVPSSSGKGPSEATLRAAKPKRTTATSRSYPKANNPRGGKRRDPRRAKPKRTIKEIHNQKSSLSERKNKQNKKQLATRQPRSTRLYTPFRPDRDRIDTFFFYHQDAEAPAR